MRRRRRRKLLRPYTTPADLPLVPKTPDMERVLNLSAPTIYRRIKAETLKPMPTERRPFRWRKSDVLRALGLFVKVLLTLALGVADSLPDL